LAGEVGEAQATALVRARTPATEEALADDEEVLVGQACALRYDHFTRVLAYWYQHVDPDEAEDDAAAKADARRFHLSQGFGDMWFADGVLDPIAGAVVWPTRFGASPTSSSRPTGSRPGPAWETPPPWATWPAPGVRAGRRHRGQPRLLVPWLEEAWVERVVFDGPSRVIDVGVARRCSPGPPAERCRCATGSAFTSCATSPPRSARSTTSSRGAPAGKPWPPTGGRRVPTGGGTDDRSRRLGGGAAA
ncbi:MAG: hypothetical protein M3N25_08920, partial [Actinomycetota bacterium]|nr:hypothetical protein [Actinomycetota bacterium]